MGLYLAGATDFVGGNLLKVALEYCRADISATVHRRQPDPLVDCAYGAVGLDDRGKVLASVRAFQPKAIVHCAAVPDIQADVPPQSIMIMYGDWWEHRPFS